MQLTLPLKEELHFLPVCTDLFCYGGKYSNPETTESLRFLAPLALYSIYSENDGDALYQL